MRPDFSHHRAREVAGIRTIGEITADFIDELMRVRLAQMKPGDRKLFLIAEHASGRLTDDQVAFWFYLFPDTRAA